MKRFDLSVAQNYESDIRKKICGYDELHILIKSFIKLNLSVENARVLIIGAGTGEELKYLLPMDKITYIKALDPSAEMLTLAKKQVREQHAKKILFEEASFDQYQGDKLYNLALSILVSHFVPHKDKLNYFKKISDKLTTGGMAIIVDSFMDNPHEQDSLFRLWFQVCSENYSELELQKIREDFSNKFFPMSTDSFLQLLEVVSLKVDCLFFRSSIFSGYVVKKR